MDTQQLSFSKTVVAIRKARAQCQSQSIKYVCAAQAQSRDQTTDGENANAKVLTYKCDCCGLCGVGIFMICFLGKSM